MARPALLPVLLAAALALLWLALGPPTPDLAAQAYRTDLFAREGFTVWNGFWFGGHHTPGYSILFPPLGALFGPRLVGAIAAVASAALFAAIIRRHADTPAAARWAAVWFAAATATDLFIGRLTFGLGVTVGLACVLAAQRGRPRLALALAVGCTLASPVAGLFLAMCGVADWLAHRRRLGLAVAAAAMGPALALAVAFPEGGAQPFSAGALLAIAAVSALIVRLVPADERTIRTVALLYVASAALAFVVASPMGGNASRLGAMFAGPVLVAVALGRIPARTLALAAVPLLVWQWYAPVRETFKGATDPSADPAYFQPLLGFLEAQADASDRVEIPFTRLHWEAVNVAREFPLARGWETQLDVKYNGLFHGDRAHRLTADDYRRWLLQQGVRFVAVPDVPLDPSARAEARVIASRPAWLRPVWRARDWRVYEVRGRRDVARGAEVVRLGPETVTVRMRAPGTALVRVRWTPYWTITRGRACVAPARGGWTTIRASRPGIVTLRARFTLSRLVFRGKRCTATPIPRLRAVNIPARHVPPRPHPGAAVSAGLSRSGSPAPALRRRVLRLPLHPRVGQHA